MSPFSDGTPAVSQWPIPPLHYFDYEFQLQAGDAGTYFYHSHVGFSAITATGPLIIDEGPHQVSPYSYDEERTFFLSDVYHSNDSYLVSGMMATPYRAPGDINNIALNGHSRAPAATAKSVSCSFATVNIQPNKIYRFRFIGANVASQIFLAFQDHDYLMLIEVDGHYVSPLVVTHLEISSGQRYSLIFRAKSREELLADGKRQYYVQMETRGTPQTTTTYGVLVYEDTASGLQDQPVDTFTIPRVKPVVLPGETFTEGWLEDDLHPLPSHPYGDVVPSRGDVTRLVVIGLQEVIFPNKSVTWRADVSGI